MAKARTPEMEDIAGFRVLAADQITESKWLWLEQPAEGGDRRVVISNDGDEQRKPAFAFTRRRGKMKLRHRQVNKNYLNCAEMVLSCVSENES